VNDVVTDGDRSESSAGDVEEVIAGFGKRRGSGTSGWV